MSENIFSDESKFDLKDNLLNKLKRIRPYTESQLLALHQNELNQCSLFINDFIKNFLNLDDNQFYHNLEELHKWRKLLKKSREEINMLADACEDDQANIWKLTKKKISKKGKCEDGRIVEANHSFNEASFQEVYFKSLEQNLLNIKNTLINDHCYHLYMSQITQKHIEFEMNEAINENNVYQLLKRVKILLSCLFAFHRKFEDDDKLDILIKQWTTHLIAVFLKHADFSDHLFILNHVLRCPSGISYWAIDFVQCPTPLKSTNHEAGLTILNHCINVISTILSPVKAREQFISPSNSEKTCKQSEGRVIGDNYWHLVDADVDEGEDVTVDRRNLSENDVIHLLKQVPYDDILKYLTERNDLNADFSIGFDFGDYSEISMLKLLSISTQLIQILRQGLITFNCMRFRALTNYITSLIRKTVFAVTIFWQNCKGCLLSQDAALILRLQVEYDHFILRSVATILSCQRYGIWKFVSVIPFNGITESMMWHIVWVFYNNGRDEIDELGGLCPYFSDAYWKSKFNEPAMKFLFTEKLPNLSQSELDCLLLSLSNMIKSRSQTEHEFISTIALEIFEISFILKGMTELTIKTAIETLTECVLQHSFIISVILNKIKDSQPSNEAIIELFAKLPIHIWKPFEDIELLGNWICSTPIKSLTNRIARIILIKLNYDLEENMKLFLTIKEHRSIALLVLNGILEQMKNCEILNSETTLRGSFTSFDSKSALDCAKSTSSSSFVEWSWRVIFLLKVNQQDQPIITVKKSCNLKNESFCFFPIPNVNIDCEVFPIFKSLESKNFFAVYLALIMTNIGHSESSFDSAVDMIIYLNSSRCYIQALNILHYFVPLHSSKLEILKNNSKFISSFHQLVTSDDYMLLDFLIGLIEQQVSINENKNEIILFWMGTFCEITNIIFKQYSSSWFIASSKGLEQIVYLINEIVAFIFLDEALMNIVISFFAQRLNEMQMVKVSSGSFSNFFSFNSNAKKLDCFTPFHFICERYSNKTWFVWLLIKSDSLRMEKIWESILIEMRQSVDLQIETVIRLVCTSFNKPLIPVKLLPINSWSKLALDVENDHPLVPLIWYNFFVCFFANPTSGGSFGLRFIPETMIKKLKTKLNLLTDYHHKLWSDNLSNNQCVSSETNSDLIKFYRASLLWLQNFHLHDPFVDIDHLSQQYCVELLKCVMNGIDGPFKSYINNSTIVQSHLQYVQRWSEVKTLKSKLDFFKKENSALCMNNDLNLTMIEPPNLNQVSTFNFYSNQWNFSSDAKFDLIKKNICTIMEEKKSFDSRCEKMFPLNSALTSLICNLYSNKKKEIRIQVPCDKDNYDPDGCVCPASIVFQFFGAIENVDNRRSIERNRMDFSLILNELLELPSEKAIESAIFIEKSLPLINENGAKNDTNVDLNQFLLKHFLSYVEENPITFAPAKNLFNMLIDNLNFEVEHKKDINSQFLLQTSLERPHVIEYLTPRLVPSKCSINCFLQMYETLQKSIHKTNPHILFVLLSKFDVNLWLKSASVEKSLQFLDLLVNSLFSLSQNPDEQKSIILGLFRKHLQYMVICRFPIYLQPVIQKLLQGMNSHLLYPAVWNDVLLSFGLYLPIDNFQPKDLISEIRKYAESQPIFSANELYALLTLLLSHYLKWKKENFQLELLQYFKPYIQSFSLFLSTLSFMWIYLNFKDQGLFENVWKPFLDAWKLWLFPTDLTLTIDRDDFDHFWNFFIHNLQYFIHYYLDCSTLIFSQFWRMLAKYYANARISLSSTSETIQQKLKLLPWNRYVPTLEDIKLMFEASQHERCPPVILISHILYTVNWNNCVQFIPYQDISQAMEWLTWTIIMLVDKPELLSLNELPIHLMDSLKADSICRMLRHKIRLDLYLIKITDRTAMWINIIKIVCGIGKSQTSETFQNNHDLTIKKLVYVETFCGLSLDAIKNDEKFVKDNETKFINYFRSCLIDVRTCLTTQSDHRTKMLTIIAKFINNLCKCDNQLIINIIELILSQLENEKTIILELISCSCQNITNSLSLLVQMVKRCLHIFADLEGQINEIVPIFKVSYSFDSNFFEACYQQQAFQTMLIFYQCEKSSKNIISLISEMSNWSCQLKPIANSEAEVFGLWFILIKDIYYHISEKESALPVLQSTITLAKHFISIADEVLSAGFLSFIKSAKKSISFRSAFLSVTMAEILLIKSNEVVNSCHPLCLEIKILIKSTIAKLQAMRKHKGFVEIYPLIDKALELNEFEDKIDLMGIKLTRSWLLAFYSNVSIFRFILSEITS